MAIAPTHVQLLVSRRDDELQSAVVSAKLKNLISRELNLGLEDKRKWLSRGASRQRVKDREHFSHLVESYLPKHRGLFWCEGMPNPWGDPSAPADG